MKNAKRLLVNGLLAAGLLTAPVFAEEPETREEKKDGFYRRARKNPVDIDRINEIFSTITRKVLASSDIVSEAEIKLDQAFFHPVIGRAEFHGDAGLGEWGGMGARLQLYKYPNPLRFGMVEGARLDLRVDLNNFGELRSRLPFDEITESCDEVMTSDPDSDLDQLDAEVVFCKVFETVRDSESFAEFQENVDPYLAQVKKLATEALRNEIGEARRLLAYGYRNKQCKLLGGALCKPHLDVKIGGTAAVAGLSGFVRISQGELKIALKLESVSWLNGRIIEGGQDDFDSLEEWVYEGFKEAEKTTDEEIEEAAEDVAEFIEEIQESIDEALNPREDQVEAPAQEEAAE